MCNLSNIFSVYGFKKTEQHLELVRLLYLANCFNLQIIEEDLNALACDKAAINAIQSLINSINVNPDPPKNLHTFPAEIILNKLILDTQSSYPKKLVDWLIRVTQREFLLRKPGQQERWQEKIPVWIVEHAKEIAEIIENIGIKNEVPPKENFYDAIAVFGSAAPNVKKRLEYTKYLVDQVGVKTKFLYFLTGERYASERIDGNKQYLQQVAHNYRMLYEKVTETQLILASYEEIKGENAFAELPVIVIDTPRGNKSRPNTVDTLLKLAEEIDSSIKTMLFVSAAPDIQRQAEETILTLSELLPQLKIEVVGNRINGISNQANCFIIDAIAEMLFSGYPQINIQLGSKKSVEELEKRRQQITVLN